MKKLLLAFALLMAACAPGAPVEPKAVSHPAAAVWANALCQKDAQAIFDNSTPEVAPSVEAVQEELAILTVKCEGTRFVGVVNTKNGPEFFFAVDVGDHEVWYGLTVKDGKVAAVE